jgi:hypothetical protein
MRSYKLNHDSASRAEPLRRLRRHVQRVFRALVDSLSPAPLPVPIPVRQRTDPPVRRGGC